MTSADQKCPICSATVPVINGLFVDHVSLQTGFKCTWSGSAPTL